MVHRDLKPENLLVIGDAKRDFIKVLDFGVVRAPSFYKTLTGAIVGTPRYMPPEQIHQEEIDGRADIYALGVILFECLSGKPPIAATSSMEYLHLNLYANPSLLSTHWPDVPPALDRLLSQMMAKSRDDRPATMAAVGSALQEIAVAKGWIGEATGRHRIADLTSSGHMGETETLQHTPLFRDNDLTHLMGDAPKGKQRSQVTRRIVESPTIDYQIQSSIGAVDAPRKSMRAIWLLLLAIAATLGAGGWAYLSYRAQDAAEYQEVVVGSELVDGGALDAQKVTANLDAQSGRRGEVVMSSVDAPVVADMLVKYALKTGKYPKPAGTARTHRKNRVNSRRTSTRQSSAIPGDQPSPEKGYFPKVSGGL
jgi:hypothetical protein